jgi:threonine dehydrogenase-like Zn-dependent dehydrogenase
MKKYYVVGRRQLLQPGDAVFAAEPHAEFMLADARRVIRLAAGVDFEAGAFTYLPTLGLHALRSADYAVGDNVLVIGQGLVGVLAAQVAQLAGARVVALEVDAQRRSVAEQAGIRTVVDPREAGALERVEAFFGAPGPDVIVETSQNWSGLMDAMRLAHTGSQIAVLSIYRTPPPDELAREVLRATFMDRERFHNQRVRFIACSNDPADDHPPDVVRWTITPKHALRRRADRHRCTGADAGDHPPLPLGRAGAGLRTPADRRPQHGRRDAPLGLSPRRSGCCRPARSAYTG